MNTDKIYAEQLANEYTPKDTSKVVALRKLVGMCLSMKVIGSGSDAMFILGIIVGIIGFVGVAVNYPIYKKLLNKGKKKYAFEIVQLAKKISEKDM